MGIITKGEEITKKELIAHLKTLSLEKLWEICKGKEEEIVEEAYELIKKREAERAQKNFELKKTQW